MKKFRPQPGIEFETDDSETNMLTTIGIGRKIVIKYELVWMLLIFNTGYIHRRYMVFYL